jgi:hypothetical protein
MLADEEVQNAEESKKVNGRIDEEDVKQKLCSEG